MNFYLYSMSRPLAIIDVYGLYGWSDAGAAYWHYCKGNGGSWRTNFNSLNWGGLDQRIENKIMSKIGSSCIERVIPVNETVEGQTAGADAYIIGRNTVRITGKISINCDCTWDFSGIKKSDQGKDTYNFNPSNRSFIPETLTTVGRNGCGLGDNPKDFLIYIDGQASVNLNGSVNGTNECICRK